MKRANCSLSVSRQIIFTTERSMEGKTPSTIPIASSMKISQKKVRPIFIRCLYVSAHTLLNVAPLWAGRVQRPRITFAVLCVHTWAIHLIQGATTAAMPLATASFQFDPREEMPFLVNTAFIVIVRNDKYNFELMIPRFFLLSFLFVSRIFLGSHS